MKGQVPCRFQGSPFKSDGAGEYANRIGFGLGGNTCCSRLGVGVGMVWDNELYTLSYCIVTSYLTWNTVWLPIIVGAANY